MGKAESRKQKAESRKQKTEEVRQMRLSLALTGWVFRCGGWLWEKNFPKSVAAAGWPF
jgi:hypothetical protein